MASHELEPPNVTDSKQLTAFRRLLLSKQLYLHALDHSTRAGPLNKMIAVHGFHNAIEIALRAIFLQYEIRAERQLNIDFEAMLKEIDDFPAFKDKDRRLPYRQELRNLNQLRNLVQHHAVEPESATMDDWRVFTRRFLLHICQDYFGVEFDGISPLDLVDDMTVQRLLRLSRSQIEESNIKKALVITRLVLEWASHALLDLVSDETERVSLEFRAGFPVGSNKAMHEYCEKAFEILASSTERMERYTVLLTSGISLADYRRFELATPSLTFTVGGTLIPTWAHPDKAADKAIACWAHDFAVNAIVQWQSLGFSPGVPDYTYCREMAEKLLRGDDAVIPWI